MNKEEKLVLMNRTQKKSDRLDGNGKNILDSFIKVRTGRPRSSFFIQFEKHAQHSPP